MTRTAALALYLSLPAACAAVQRNETGEPSHGPGLWIGPIQACAAIVERADLGIDEATGGVVVEIGFSADVQPRLRDVTARLVGRPMPVRLDGRILSEPIVMEAITGRELHLNVESQKQARRIAARTRDPC